MPILDNESPEPTSRRSIRGLNVLPSPSTVSNGRELPSRKSERQQTWPTRLDEAHRLPQGSPDGLKRGLRLVEVAAFLPQLSPLVITLWV